MAANAEGWEADMPSPSLYSFLAASCLRQVLKAKTSASYKRAISLLAAVENSHGGRSPLPLHSSAYKARENMGQNTCTLSPGGPNTRKKKILNFLGVKNEPLIQLILVRLMNRSLCSYIRDKISAQSSKSRLLCTNI